MTLRLVRADWGTELAQALRADTSALKVISPFIKLRALERLLALSPQSIQAITRFNLYDLAMGDLDAPGSYPISRVPEPLAGRLPVHA